MSRSPDPSSHDMVEQLRGVFTRRDLAGFGAMLADDARWGDDDHPRRCRSRDEVLATFSRLLADGAEAEVTELEAGDHGLLCGLEVQWPDGVHPDDRRLYHVYTVRDHRIDEIRRYDDRASAADAAGIPAADEGLRGRDSNSQPSG